MLQYLEWHWTCNNKKFEGKLDALKEQVQSKQAVHFHAPNVYNKSPLTGLCVVANPDCPEFIG